jgi:Calcineurin-like phosphoesterase
MSLNRRKFVKNSLIIAGGLAASRVFPGCVRSSDNGSELFSFVQINDTHINVPGNEGYPKVEEKLRSVISSINSEDKFPLPDFVLFPGDIIQGTKLKFLQPECEFSKNIMDELKCPYFTVVGNHEVLDTENNPRFLNAYERTFGKDRVNYSFVHKGFHFVLFDNSNSLGSIKEATISRNEWLSKTLNEYATYPKIIICHIPLISFREDEILEKSFGHWTYKLRGENTWRIIQKYSNKIIAVLNGHIHLTGVIKTNNYWLSFLFSGEDDIYHISPSGLASYPCHYAYYKVYENKIDVKMIQVESKLVTPSSNIHGKLFHNKDFIDAKHKTPESYVCGNSDERVFSIPLSKSKRVSS